MVVALLCWSIGILEDELNINPFAHNMYKTYHA
jgi:hypothetical protein